MKKFVLSISVLALVAALVAPSVSAAPKGKSGPPDTFVVASGKKAKKK